MHARPRSSGRALVTSPFMRVAVVAIQKNMKEEIVRSIQSRLYLALCMGCIAVPMANAADIIVSAQDGKFVRVEGRATYPEPAPSDSLVVLDASQFPPVVKGTVEGLEHTVQGPPQAVAVTPDGKLAIVAAPTRYDYAAKKELFDNFLQIVDLIHHRHV